LEVYRIYLVAKPNTKIRYPIEYFVSLARLSPPFKHVILSINGNVKPSTYEIASKHHNWRKAMDEELKTFEKNNT